MTRNEYIASIMLEAADLLREDDEVLTEGIRDNIKNKQYFDNFIDYETNRIQHFSEYIKNGTSKIPDSTKMSILNFYKNKITAMYSAGYSKNEIRNIFDQSKEYMDSDSLSYGDIIDSLSLSILFDDDITQNIKYNKFINDAFLNILKNYIKTKKIIINDKLSSRYYNNFIEILRNPENAKEKIQDYLNNRWYNSNKDSSWYDSHKRTTDTYAGYWCWEAAAIAKMLGLSGRDFINCKYMPIDLI